MALVRGLPLNKIYFVPGNEDWAYSGLEGLKAVRRSPETSLPQFGLGFRIDK